jgi:hypothetical protein
VSERPGPYDPELPILAELEQVLRARAAAASAGGAARDGRRPAPRRARAASASYRGGRRAGRALGGTGAAGAGRAGTAGAGAGGVSAAGAGGTGAAGAGRAERQAPPQRRDGWRRRGGTIARRSAALVSLSLLVGASAVATRSIVADGGGDPSLRTTRAAELAAGRAAGERWTLSAARRGEDLCHGLLAGGAVSTRCQAPPAATGVVVDGLATAAARYVAGVTGERVARVVITRGDLRRVVATHPLPPSAAVRRARLPQTLRWFVVALPLPRGDASSAPVRIAPHGRDGEALRPALLRCPGRAAQRRCDVAGR